MASFSSSDVTTETRVYTVVRSELVASGENASEVESQVVAQYFVNTNLWATAGAPVTVTYDNRGEISGSHDIEGLIKQAVATWDAVTPNSFDFSYTGVAQGDAGGCASPINLDGMNTIKFAPLGGTLGLTCTVYLGTGPTNKLVEFDMLLSNDASLWSSSAVTPANKFDLPSTILHELGHAAGLGHAAPGTVMDGTLSPGTQRRELTAGDATGLRTAYPPRLASAAAGSNLTQQGRLFQLRAAFVAFD